MKTKMLFAAAAAALTVAGSAHADDAQYFNGLYVGAEAGYSSLGSGFNGFYYGGVLAARKQLDNDIVFGVEGSFGKANIDYLDNIWTANGTVGYAFGDDKRNLIFGGIGYARARASGFGITVDSGAFSSIAGYERAIGKNLSLRIKGNMYDTSEVTVTGGLGFRF